MRGVRCGIPNWDRLCAPFAFPDDGGSFVVGVADLPGLHLLFGGGDAEGVGEFGVALNDEDRAFIDEGAPGGGGDGGAGGEDDDVGGAGVAGSHADGLEDGGPGAGVVAGDVEMEGGGGGQDKSWYPGTQEKAEEFSG